MSEFKKLEYHFSDDIIEAYENCIEKSGVIKCKKQLEEFRMSFNKLPHVSQLEELKLGYEQMAQINLDYAESCLSVDIYSLESYETILKTENE